VYRGTFLAADALVVAVGLSGGNNSAQGDALR